MLNRIILLQSLSKEEYQSGKILYETGISTFPNPHNIKHVFKIIESKNDLLTILNIIESNVESGEEVIIHIEAHGNINEFGFINGERMSWNELTNHLIKINQKLKNGLHLNLATCFSMHVAQEIDLKKNSPYKSLISTIAKVKAGKVLDENLKFYKEIFKSGKVYDAYVQFLNLNPDTKFKIKDIEIVLDYMVKFQIQRFVGILDLQILKTFFENYLNIELEIKSLRETQEKAKYILNKFKNRFLYKE